ncbi:MAG TPA: hypothetical protein ENN09_01830, partial [Planctomycetes bacterium]|nr:hypothetical protein [Planctomycetota bacterium]
MIATIYKEDAMRHIAAMLLFPAFICAALTAGETRLQCTRDVWISSYGTVGMGGSPPETDCSMGKTPTIKLKTIQEAGLFDFDTAPVRGRKIDKAVLMLHEAEPTQLRWMGVSTVSSNWEEGSGAGSYVKDAAGGGATFNEASYQRRAWSYPGSRLTDVTMSAGNTIEWHGECRRLPGGWLPASGQTAAFPVPLDGIPGAHG